MKFTITVGNYETMAEGFDGTEEDIGLIATSFYNGLWAYDSWYVYTY